MEDTSVTPGPYVCLTCISKEDCLAKIDSQKPNQKYSVSGDKCVPFTGCQPPTVLYGERECKTEDQCKAISGHFVSNDKKSCMTCGSLSQVEFEGACITKDACKAKPNMVVSTDGFHCVNFTNCGDGKVLYGDKECLTPAECAARTGKCSVSADNKTCECERGPNGICNYGECQTSLTNTACRSIQSDTPGGFAAGEGGICFNCGEKSFPSMGGGCVDGLIASMADMRRCIGCTVAENFRNCVKTGDTTGCTSLFSPAPTPGNTITCSSGTYWPGGNARSCTTCRQNHYCVGGTFNVSSGEDGIKECPPGTTSSAGKSSCTDDGPDPTRISCPGGKYFELGDTVCNKDCPANYYCEKGQFLPSQWADSRKSCPSTAKFSMKGSSSSASCKNVNASSCLSSNGPQNQDECDICCAVITPLSQNLAPNCDSASGGIYTSGHCSCNCIQCKSGWHTESGRCIQDIR